MTKCQNSAFIRRWEPMIWRCARRMLYKHPDLASDLDDLVQVGRIEVYRRRAQIEGTDSVAWKAGIVRRNAHWGMVQYLRTFRGWARGVRDSPAKTGPARLRASGEGSDSTVWDMLSVPSGEEAVLLADMRRHVRELADTVLTAHQKRVFFAELQPTETFKQRRRAHDKLLAAVLETEL